MSLIKMLIWVFGTTGLLIIFTNKKFETICPISVILGVLFLYAFGFINHVSFGYYLSWIMPLSFALIFVSKLIKKDKDWLKNFIHNYLTIGSILCFILLVYVFFLNRYTLFTSYDEFSHWGPMVRETLKYDSFYAIEESSLIQHKDYPPFFALLESFWCFFAGGNYSEPNCYRAINSFMFILCLPVFSFFEIKDKKHWIYSLVIALCIVLVPFAVYSINAPSDGFNLYKTIYVDWNLAVFFAYSFFVAYSYENNIFKWINLGFCFVALLLMKQSGLPLFLLVLVYYLFNDFLLKKQRNPKQFIFLLVIPVLFYLSWKYEINVLGVSESAQFDLGSIDYAEFIQIIKGSGGELWQQEAAANFLNALTERSIFLKPFAMSYVVHILLITAILAVLCIVERKKNFLLPVFYLVGSIGYALMMLILYTNSFGSYEGPRLASYERYMATYIFAGICLIISVLAFNITKAENRKTEIILTLAALIFTVLSGNVSSYNVLIPSTEYEGMSTNENYQRTRYVVSDICQNKKVLIVESYLEDGIYDSLLLNYEFGDYSSVSYEIFNVHDYFSEDYSVEDWKEYLSEFDRIYLLNVDDEFIDNYWTSITDEYILNYGLYECNIANDEVNIRFLDSYESW